MDGAAKSDLLKEQKEIMDYCIAYIAANGAVMVLVLAQLLRMERRLGCGGTIISQVKKRCPLFNGNDCKQAEVKADGKKEMG